MKVAKDYSNVSTVYYRPEMQNCLECESRLERSHRVWNEYIIQLTGTIYAVSMGYRCPNDECSLDVIYRSAVAESLSLKYYSFGMDVIARIGDMRFSRNQTLGEIHENVEGCPVFTRGGIRPSCDGLDVLSMMIFFHTHPYCDMISAWQSNVPDMQFMMRITTLFGHRSMESGFCVVTSGNMYTSFSIALRSSLIMSLKS